MFPSSNISMKPILLTVYLCQGCKMCSERVSQNMALDHTFSFSRQQNETNKYWIILIWEILRTEFQFLSSFQFFNANFKNLILRQRTCFLEHTSNRIFPFIFYSFHPLLHSPRRHILYLYNPWNVFRGDIPYANRQRL